MKFIRTEIPDVILIEPKVFRDGRGFFMELWKESVFSENGINAKFVQENHSASQKGILRGLHYQIKQPQGKLVRVIAGEIFDVAVDLRKKSPHFGKWVGAVLSAENKKMLWIPAGFAHGFYVTSDSAEVVYKCTDYYAPEHERAIAWNDADLGIKWPVAKDASPVLSSKDAVAAPFAKAEHY
jgi:dTDP-4-dehydrorhamnose 3,5-epimerase